MMLVKRNPKETTILLRLLSNPLRPQDWCLVGDSAPGTWGNSTGGLLFRLQALVVTYSRLPEPTPSIPPPFEAKEPVPPAHLEPRGSINIRGGLNGNQGAVVWDVKSSEGLKRLSLMQSGFFQGSNNPVTSANCSNTVCDGVAGMDFRVRLARKCDPSRVLQFLSQLWYKDVSNKVPLKRICVGVRAALRRHTSDRASKRQGLGPRSTDFISEPTIKLLYPCHRTCKMESPLDLSSSTNGCAKACGQRFSHKARKKHCPIKFAVPRLQGVIHCTVLSWSFCSKILHVTRSIIPHCMEPRMPRHTVSQARTSQPASTSAWTFSRALHRELSRKQHGRSSAALKPPQTLVLFLGT